VCFGGMSWRLWWKLEEEVKRLVVIRNDLLGNFEEMN
jgi:hypothetical protein